MRAETSRELESRVETGFGFQESCLNWGRALGKSLDHFTPAAHWIERFLRVIHPRLLDLQNVVVPFFVTMSARVVTVSVYEYLVIIHLQVKASHGVLVRQAISGYVLLLMRSL